jgi:uncharacterized membrane protein YqhA
VTGGDAPRGKHVYEGAAMKKIFEKATLIVYLPVTVLLLSSVITAVYGTWQFGILIINGFTDQAYRDPGVMSTKILSIIDIYLLVIIQFIISVGLHELFIGPLDTPLWLKITTIDQLKSSIASVIVLFLAIFFAHFAVEAEHMVDLAYAGIGIAAMIAALVYYYKVKTSQE